MRVQLVSLLLFPLIGFVGFSQKLVFDHIGPKNGLPASEVYNVFQDRLGYVWIFTEYGIVKHNGSTLVPVCENLSPDDYSIYAMAESADGNLYIVNSNAEIYQIYRDKAYKVKGIEGASNIVRKENQQIYDLFFDDQNTMWFSTDRYSFKFDRNHYFTPKLSKQKERRKRNRTLQVYPAKTNLIVNGKKKKRFKHADLKVIRSDQKQLARWSLKNTILDGYSFTERTQIRTHRGKIIIGISDKLLVREKNGQFQEKNIGYGILSLEIARNGHIWLGLRSGGLMELNDNLQIVGQYFGNTNVSDLTFDSEGGLWATTIGKGIYHCKNVNMRYYDYLPELRGSISILEECNNNFFVGTHEGRLFSKQGSVIKPISFERFPTGILSISYINGEYNIGTYIGFHTLKPKESVARFKHFEEYICPLYGIGKLRDRKKLFVLSSGIAIVESNGSSKRIIDDVRSRCLAERNPQEFFIAAGSKILRMDNSVPTYPSYLKPLNNYRIKAIRTDQDKNVWFCTKEKAVFCLNRKNELEKFVDLPADILTDIDFTSDGRILLATNKGAFVSTVNFHNKKNAWKLVLGGEITKITEHNSIVLIGTKEGLVEIDVNKLTTKKKYNFHLRSVKSNREEVRFQNGKVLNANQNNLIFSYDVLNYQNNSKRLYYQLDGPTSLKGAVLGTQVQLQNLEPGTYRLQVYPELDMEPGKGMMIKSHFTIRPAFWQTTLFQVSALVFLLWSVLLAFWWYNKRKNEKRQAREEIERQLTEYRLTALKSQINPHFMSNSLVAIQNLILQNDIDNANLYIAKFSLLLRSLLEYSNKSFASLKNELAMIELYVELEQLRFSNKFIFELTIDQNIDQSELLIPALITQPFIENAIWHGLLPLDQQRNPKLELKVGMENSVLVISIIDNGVGRNFKRDVNGKHESRGTDLIISRVEHLNQLYHTTGGKVEFIDLHDDNHQSRGTHVKIYLPETILNELHHG